MKKYFYTLFILSQAPIFLHAQKVTRENIIIFMVDDMGWTDMSLSMTMNPTTMNKRYHTPNIELLAKDGIKYTRAYAQPVCTPSRISLMTGLNVRNHKVSNWTLNKNEITDEKDSTWISDRWNMNGWSPMAEIPHTIQATTIPQIFIDNGYHTIHCGKAHFGARGTPGEDPKTLGFTINIAGHAAGGLGSHLSNNRFGNKPGESHSLPWGVPDMEKYYDQHITLTQALTNEAIIELKKTLPDKLPFFLYMSHYTVHIPIEPDTRFYDKYLMNGLSKTEAAYASMVEGMDHSLGEIIKFLKENNLYENTSILFLSDNGGYSWPSRNNDNLPFTSNAPLRAGKGSLYEGGIRIPLIIKSNSLKEKNIENNTPLIIEDLFPTILEIAQIKNYKTTQKLDGISLYKHRSDKFLVFHYPHKWINEIYEGVNYRSACIQGDWKLVHNQLSGKKELFNLRDDIGEKIDLYEQKNKLANKLSKKLLNKLNSAAAPMPRKIV